MPDEPKAGAMHVLHGSCTLSYKAKEAPPSYKKEPRLGSVDNQWG